MPRRVQVEEGSGNVFADIGLPNPEEALAKAEIARQINRILMDRGLTKSGGGGRTSENRATSCVRPGPGQAGKVLAGKAAAVCPAGRDRCRNPDETIQQARSEG